MKPGIKPYKDRKCFKRKTGSMGKFHFKGGSKNPVAATSLSVKDFVHNLLRMPGREKR